VTFPDQDAVSTGYAIVHLYCLRSSPPKSDCALDDSCPDVAPPRSCETGVSFVAHTE